MAQVAYGLYGALNKRPVGVKIKNESEILNSDQKWFDAIDKTIRGFEQFPIKDRIKFSHNNKWGRRPLDFENFRGFWMLSDACKAFFENQYPGAMEFVLGEIHYENINESHCVWLADAINIVDALDEHSSDIKIITNGRKSYFLSGSRNLVFIKCKLADHYIFRMKYAEYMVICRPEVREEFRHAGLKGAMFIEIGHINEQGDVS